MAILAILLAYFLLDTSIFVHLNLLPTLDLSLTLSRNAFLYPSSHTPSIRTHDYKLYLHVQMLINCNYISCYIYGVKIYRFAMYLRKEQLTVQVLNRICRCKCMLFIYVAMWSITVVFKLLTHYI